LKVPRPHVGSRHRTLGPLRVRNSDAGDAIDRFLIEPVSLVEPRTARCAIVAISTRPVLLDRSSDPIRRRQYRKPCDMPERIDTASLSLIAQLAATFASELATSSVDLAAERKANGCVDR